MRTVEHFGVLLRVQCDPVIVDICPSDPYVPWIKAHMDLLALQQGIPKLFRPICEIVDDHPSARV